VTGCRRGRLPTSTLRTRPLSSRATRHCRLVLLFVSLAVLAGCVGDFNQPRPLLFGDDSVAGLPAAWIQPGRSQFAFTDDELRMRNLAYPLLMPPCFGGLWGVIPLDLGYAIVMADRGPLFDTVAYGNAVLAMWVRSEAARYARLSDDVRDDMIRIDRYYFTARHVVDMDRKRVRSFAYVAGLTAYERTNALERVADNTRIIDRVGRALKLRAASYRFALERLAIAQPSPLAAEADRAIRAYEQRISLLGPALAVLSVRY
jgi:hypothetical protein